MLYSSEEIVKIWNRKKDEYRDSNLMIEPSEVLFRQEFRNVSDGVAEKPVFIDEESYRILTFAKNLYRMKPDTALMDYYERIVFNQMKADPSLLKDGIAFLKEWSDGTYTLFINYYIPCEINFEKEKIHVEIKDEAPDDNGKFFGHVIAEGEKLRNVKVRPPYWAQMGDNDSGHIQLEDGRMHHEVWAEFTYSFRIEKVTETQDKEIWYGPYKLKVLNKDYDNVEISEEALKQKAKVLSMDKFEFEGLEMRRFCESNETNLL